MRNETAEEHEVRELEHLVEEVEYGSDTQLPGGRWVLPALAGTWSLFQLLLPYSTPLANALHLPFSLHSGLVRAIHLAFAIALVFLSFPHWRRRSLRHVAPSQRLGPTASVLAYLLAGTAALAAA